MMQMKNCTKTNIEIRNRWFNGAITLYYEIINAKHKNDITQSNPSYKMSIHNKTTDREHDCSSTKTVRVTAYYRIRFPVFIIAKLNGFTLDLSSALSRHFQKQNISAKIITKIAA